MKEPIEQIKEWLQSEIGRLKELSYNPETKNQISIASKAIAHTDALLKIAEFEEACHNAFIDKLIEEGRKAETICEEIKHNAKEKPYGL